MLVSIIMPIYNSENHIEEAVESILEQTYNNFEFIIINDGSEDNSIKIIKSHNDDRIKIINIKHSGIATALNTAIKASKGEIIFRMDADDISENNRIEIQVNFMIENPDIDLCGSFMKVINEQGDEVAKKILPITHKEILKSIVYNSNIMHPTFCFRKKSIIKLGGYRKEFLYAQDYDLLLRGISNQYKYYNIPQFLLSYRLPSKIKYEKYYRQIRYSRFARILFYQRKKNKFENKNTINKINLISKINVYSIIMMNIFFIFNKKRINRNFPRYFWIIGSYIISIFHYELLINLYNDTKYYFKIKNVKD